MLSTARFADDAVVAFEHRKDAERFQAELRDRLTRFGVELNAEKTRLIEFGRFAVRNRQRRGLGKPETFQFLGFTHICGKSRKGRFQLKRLTDSKRLRAKLHALRGELVRRRDRPIPEQGRWLASVLRGHANYYGVPGNHGALYAIRSEVVRLWRLSLRRRSQRTRLTWATDQRHGTDGCRSCRSPTTGQQPGQHRRAGGLFVPTWGGPDDWRPTRAGLMVKCNSYSMSGNE